MRISITRAVGALVVTAGVLSTAGCLGGSDNTAACDTMKKELQDISTRATQQISDPAGMAKTYSEAAGKIRTAADTADGDVKSAGNELANALDGLATTLRNAASGQVQVPDTAGMTTAGTKLGKACS